MTETPNRQATVVGVFIAFGIAILAGGILMIGTINDSFTRKITVSAVFPEVSGLQKGDNIWFSGLKVGTVSKLAFRGVSEVEVQLNIDRDATEYIHADALAKVGSDGLIGNRIVVLYGGTANAPKLAEGMVIAVGTAVSTDQIMATLQENNTNLLAITNDLKKVTATIAGGEGSIGKLLKDDTLYENLNETVSTLAEASEHTQTLTASLSEFAADLNREGNLPHDLVNDHTTYASLRATVANLENTGKRASDIVDGLAQGAADPNSAIGTLVHDRGAGDDLKGTLDNLNESSALLAEDLEALQHNFLLRGYFKKKAKAEAKAAREAEEAAAEGDAPTQ